MQFDLFESETFQSMRQEIISMRESMMKCNRAQFREIGLLKKRVNLLEAENQQLKQIEAKRKVSTKAQLIPFFGELLEVTK